MKIIIEVKLSKEVVKQIEALDMHSEDKDAMLIAHAEDMITLGEYKVRFREEKEDETE